MPASIKSDNTYLLSIVEATIEELKEYETEQRPECIKLNREWQEYSDRWRKKTGRGIGAPILWDMSTASSPYVSSSDDEGVELQKENCTQKLKATGSKATQSG